MRNDTHKRSWAQGFMKTSFYRPRSCWSQVNTPTQTQRVHTGDLAQSLGSQYSRGHVSQSYPHVRK